MAHSEHNKKGMGGGFFLIIFGALLFMIAPWQLSETPELGWTAIIFGFIIGGLGFYLKFVRSKRTIS